MVQKCQVAQRPPTKRQHTKRTQRSNGKTQNTNTTRAVDGNPTPTSHTNPHKGPNTKQPTFVWQPKRDKQSSQTSTDTLQAGTYGYRAPDLHKNFWRALSPSQILETRASAVIVTGFYRENKNLLEVLIETEGTQKKPGNMFTLTHGQGEKEWTQLSARTHVVNETMLHIRGQVVLKQKHVNPLRVWEDACWLFTWSKSTTHPPQCTITALIKYDEEVCAPRSSTRQQWEVLPKNIQDDLRRFTQDKTQTWDLDSNELPVFMGYSFPGAATSQQNTTILIHKDDIEGKSAIPQPDVIDE